MVSPLSRTFLLGALAGVAVAALATTTVSPTQALQVGKNLVQYFVPGAGPNTGWFVDANTATLLTKSTFQSGVCDFINSTNGTKAYTYTGFGAAGCQSLTTYTRGMHLRLVVDQTNFPDSPGLATGSCTLNIDNIGLKNIKQQDGTTDPVANSLMPGREYPIWFDGVVFRLE
jgi:hypothetical protein